MDEYRQECINCDQHMSVVGRATDGEGRIALALYRCQNCGSKLKIQDPDLQEKLSRQPSLRRDVLRVLGKKPSEVRKRGKQFIERMNLLAEAQKNVHKN